MIIKIKLQFLIMPIVLIIKKILNNKHIDQIYLIFNYQFSIIFKNFFQCINQAN